MGSYQAMLALFRAGLALPQVRPSVPLASHQALSHISLAKPVSTNAQMVLMETLVSSAKHVPQLARLVRTRPLAWLATLPQRAQLSYSITVSVLLLVLTVHTIQVALALLATWLFVKLVRIPQLPAHPALPPGLFWLLPINARLPAMLATYQSTMCALSASHLVQHAWFQPLLAHPAWVDSSMVPLASLSAPLDTPWSMDAVWAATLTANNAQQPTPHSVFSVTKAISWSTQPASVRALRDTKRMQIILLASLNQLEEARS